MSTRIAHRPRYQTLHRLPQPPRLFRQPFLRDRWTYWRLTTPYQKRKLGQGLFLVPFGYRLAYPVVIG